MAKIIINILSEWDSDRMNSMIQEAFNMGFTDFMASDKAAEKLSQVDRVSLYSETKNQENSILVYNYEKEGESGLGQLLQGDKSFGIKKEISNKDDELKSIQWATQNVSFLICNTTDWKIIPFENLIAKLSTLDTQLYADVGSSLEDSELLLHTLEKGVDGLIFTPQSENDIVDIKKLLKITSNLKIETASIEEIIEIPEADRVCVDTSSMLRAGEGMLVGNTAKGFALVQAEVFESEFVNSRPFRVNAGDVSEYILVPSEEADGSIGTRTNYLSDLKAGDKLLAVNTKGETRIVFLGRVKIETRPMLLMVLKVKQEEGDIQLKITVQNAETIRLITKDNVPISVTDLNVGDEILVHVGPGATHFGTTIKETIIER